MAKLLKAPRARDQAFDRESLSVRRSLVAHTSTGAVGGPGAIYSHVELPPVRPAHHHLNKWIVERRQDGAVFRYRRDDGAPPVGTQGSILVGARRTMRPVQISTLHSEFRAVGFEGGGGRFPRTLVHSGVEVDRSDVNRTFIARPSASCRTASSNTTSSTTISSPQLCAQVDGEIVPEGYEIYIKQEKDEATNWRRSRRRTCKGTQGECESRQYHRPIRITL